MAAAASGPRRVGAGLARPGLLGRTRRAAARAGAFRPANLLTLFRVAAAGPLAALLAAGRTEAALALFAAAAATDALDGFVARFWRAQTDLGRLLDPVADKLLAAAAFGALAAQGAVPAALAALVIGRDALLLAGGALLLRRRGRLGAFRVEPLALGKLSTAAQLAYLGAVIGDLAGFAACRPWLGPLLPATVALALLSAAAYALVGFAAFRSAAAPAGRAG